ncbi:hypothetical protein DPMN_058542 [Dreissena polymorpha]|uniref:Uncharacterized protein n=1 Tax=Dreissena polymorpha TaxID=45954 RepID=A0A9D4C2C8_DREPO|nr:hypothetical protein DPMN_058542 [Dreissena polymorpha]
MAPWRPCFFKQTCTIFELFQDMSKFHEDNVSSGLFTCFHFINCPTTWKKTPPPGGHVFLPIQTIFELNCRIHSYMNKTPPPSGHIFQPTDINSSEINVASRVKNAPPLGSHVFQAKATIFELIQDIIGTNHLSKFHEEWTINVAYRVLTRFYNSHINKNTPPPGDHVFQPTGIIFELIQDMIGINLLTKFHEDWAINVVSRVLTRFYYSHLRKNAPPLGSHVFQANTNLLTKFHEDWTINVASRE